MSVTAQSKEEKQLIAEQMEANFKANMEALVQENIKLKNDLAYFRSLLSVDPDDYRKVLKENETLRAILDRLKYALEDIDYQ